MTLSVDEPEIQDGSRAWAKAQELFAGPPDSTRQRYDVDCSWYDTSVDDNLGAFCLIQAGHALEEVVGEVVQVKYRSRTIYVYCIGGADIDTPIALTRYAMLQLHDLAVDSIRVAVRPLT